MKKLLLLKYILALCVTAMFHPAPLAAQSAAFDLGLSSDTEESHDSGIFWNKIGTWKIYKKVNNVDFENNATPVIWETVSPLSFHYESGIEDSTLGYPDFVSRDGLDLLRSGPAECTEAQVVLRGLESETLYDLIFYATARAGRELDAAIQFSITEDNGKEHKDTLFVPYHNREAEMTLSKVKSDISGSLTINLSLMDGYSHGNWSALKIFPSETK